MPRVSPFIEASGNMSIPAGTHRVPPTPTSTEMAHLLLALLEATSEHRGFRDFPWPGLIYGWYFSHLFS